jgi:dienelactone hydrolase
MKKVIRLFTLLAGLCIVPFASAQSVLGTWNGSLVLPVGIMPLVFHISQDASGTYATTMDSPHQQAKDIPTQSTSFSDFILVIQIPAIGSIYKGTLHDDGTIRGTFTQKGVARALNLERGAWTEKKTGRPQEPVPPFPYKSEEVVVRNEAAGINLAGTLTLPEKGKKFPAVVLVTGSGAQNRDEELLGHKPFLVLSDYLTRNGIAVLRCDDRGTAASEGNYAMATDVDFATDAAAAIRYLQGRKEIDKRKIGILGHSSGGSVSFMTAAKDPSIAFVVSLAGPGVRGDSVLLKQVETLYKLQGMTADEWTWVEKFMWNNYAILQQTEKAPEVLEKELYGAIMGTMSAEQQQDANMIQKMAVEARQMTSPWYLHMMRYEPSVDLQHVKCPVLALNGERDIQVNAAMNLEGIRRHLAGNGNKRITVKAYPHLNHLFQTCKTGAPAEYAELEETISPAVLQDITTWILQQTR